MSNPQITALIAELPDNVVVTDPDIVASYRQDRAADPDAGTPMAVVRPSNTEQVQTVLRWATAHRIPVVPRGAGTGLSGGATAVDGGIVLSTEKMRDITVDPVTRTAVVQPGLLNAEVKAAVAAHGLWYPPDPSSFEICSIGGNIATNAGGLCCVKYGVTTDYVLGLQVVLADGTAVRLGGPRLKDVAGLSLTKLFVGSEGTLGVITEVTLRLLPAQPASSTVVATFGSVRAACDSVVAITGRIRPAMLEFMDAVSINAVEDKLRVGLDRSAAAMMVAAVFDLNFPALLVIAAVLGGITNPLYSLLVAYTNDYLDRSDMASASAGLIFINGLGAVSGPLITGWMMGRIGPNGYFLFMGLLLAGLALYGGWRATRRRTAQSVQTGGFAVLSPSASPIAVEAAIEGAAADTSEDGNDISQDD